MSKWCRIHDDGYVLEIFDTDPVAYLHPSLYEQTKSCPDTINPGDYFHDGEWHPRPAFAIEFNSDLPGWIIDDAAALENARQTKIAAIDARTTELVKRGFTFASKQFSMSDAAQRNWIALSSGLANGLLPFPMVVSTIDESSHVLASGDELKAFLGAYLTYQADPAQPLGAGRILKELVTAATTIEEVEAIVDDRA